MMTAGKNLTAEKPGISHRHSNVYARAAAPVPMSNGSSAANAAERRRSSGQSPYI
ncbi:hypothetical protein Bsp3421_000356 (plasmid) [Burkholderia sp. FERM BP-3421]|jgi:hypothetical protein|uniref:hypothetical protein n=1 Tax=Burkholderia sp. FERM BP-3421 TaxID=1494466 RepID=UPI00236108B3|nr:hypothetical protein [Burkholderia sp. FERM BP-3421]WDD90508.1 hypothetical protein Bsp3421_000356 [Burkholderia sp. FERM BP-3421]